ncbi:MAG TPA: GtrA family protein [Thermoplasmata archaeon]|nr:GtrA family protein [Thermoplasmata archaeon]
MVGTTVTGPPSPLSEEAPRARVLPYTLAWLSGALPALAVITALWLYPNDFRDVGEVSLGAFALMFPVAVRQLKVPRRIGFIYLLLGAGIAFAVGSILTGAANGLTDEPFTTPRYAGLLLAHQDPYIVPLAFTYVQYGQTLHFHGVYAYGPLLLFLQIPGLGYEWFALGCWTVLVLLVRKKFDIAVMLAQPYVALLAANGFNDLVVLVFLTLAFVGYEGRRQRWAEWLSLGMKQFANLFVLAYYVLRRDWRNTLVTAGVSAGFLLPFVYWSGPAVLCPAVLPGGVLGCRGGLALNYQLNDSLWLVWAVALFYPSVVRIARRRASSGLGARLVEWSGLGMEGLLRLPAFVVVGVSGVFVNLCVFTLVSLRLGPATSVALLASAAAFGVALVWNFTWNRSWAFQDRGHRSTAYHFALYGVIQVGALAVNLVVLALGVTLGLGALESQLGGILLASLIGYAANLRWNFRAPRARPGA